MVVGKVDRQTDKMKAEVDYPRKGSGSEREQELNGYVDISEIQ